MRRKSAGADLLLTAAVPGASDAAAAQRLPAADIVAMLASALPSSIQ
jgi:aminoglycoside phosphotransferase